VSLSALDENAKMLAKLLSVEDDEAAELLKMTIVIRTGEDAASKSLRRHVVALLERTVGCVCEGDAPTVTTVEVLIGEVAPITSGPVVRVSVALTELVISSEATPKHNRDANEVPEILLLIGACYAAAMAVRLGLGRSFPLPFANTIRVPVGGLLRGRGPVLAGTVDLGKVYVAGAGAIGNGLLYSLALLNVRGELHIVDPKLVTAGNLGRCLLFSAQDIGRLKAEVLAERAQPAMPGLRLVPRVGRLQSLAERSDGPWLERLVVAVDSRRARRRLQEELPGAVFDSSTTGIEEIVVHFNAARSRAACLSCIYEEDRVEGAHERHVADLLGVGVDDVREHYISMDAARRMIARHPELDPIQLVGTAYDTLFKTLCATGRLGVDEGRTILAPFSFVSVLAGAYLALELALRISSGDVTLPFNYWRASPWTSPVVELQALRRRRAGCETCGNAAICATSNQLWGWGGKEAS
jgi:hypothetical protein